MADMKEFLQLFQQQMEEQRKQTEAFVTAITKGFGPFHSEGQFSRLSTQPRNYGRTTGRVFKPSWQPTLSQTTEWPRRTNMASQLSPAKDINELSIDDIAESMRTQFDPTRYIVRERFKYWSDMKRRPGESILELAARIPQDAVTCDFVSIKDPLDEAMRTRSCVP